MAVEYVQTPFRMARDINGYADAITTPPPDFVYEIVTEDDNPTNITVPSNFPRYVAQFMTIPQNTVELYFVNFNADAFIPTIPSVTLSPQIMNPYRVEVEAGTVISVWASTGGDVFYGLWLFGVRY